MLYVCSSTMVKVSEQARVTRPTQSLGLSRTPANTGITLMLACNEQHKAINFCSHTTPRHCQASQKTTTDAIQQVHSCSERKTLQGLLFSALSHKATFCYTIRFQVSLSHTQVQNATTNIQ